MQKKRLANSYNADLQTVASMCERMRIARNCIIVARLMGKRGPTYPTLRKKFRLDMKSALAVQGKDVCGRRIKR